MPKTTFESVIEINFYENELARKILKLYYLYLIVGGMPAVVTKYLETNHLQGPLTENYVLQQLRGQFEIDPRYYSDKNSEIDFIVQNGTEIIPIEVK